MLSSLSQELLNTPEGVEAQQILRACVHCGFCLATCPSYQITGNELDSPRGRIYQIKSMMEGNPTTPETRLHLDRCLTCLACETTCPSGVRYGRLLEIGRSEVIKRAQRPPLERILRWTLARTLGNSKLFSPLLSLAQRARPLMPARIKSRVPAILPPIPWPEPAAAEKSVLVLEGCVQSSLAPNINSSTAGLLSRLGYQVLRMPKAECCGALAHHLDQEELAVKTRRQNMDAWWPLVESGLSAIVISASACSLEVKSYASLHANDPEYGHKAERISALALDVSELLTNHREQLARLVGGQPAATAIAFQAPCTLQHGLKNKDGVPRLLEACGAQLTPVPESHLCCGSSGTYSLLQPKISGALRTRKLAALQSGSPQLILTANVGCMSHLAAESEIPIQHWVEWLYGRVSSSQA
jgi:glycolate oxidase iron-sulfur subunit